VTVIYGEAPVRWAGHTGYYTYKWMWDENIACIYGGSRDLEGQRQYHAVRLEDLSPDNRKGHPQHMMAEHKSKRGR
jgi:hypothetical protein